VQVYIAEISSSKLKGLFGNCNQLYITIGISLMYFFGINFNHHHLGYSNMALIAAGIAVLFEILMLTTHESPRWLFKNGLDSDGMKVLRNLRGKKFCVTTEADVGLKRIYSVKDQVFEFRKKSVYHPFILVFLLMFFQQFSGINAATFYASQIFTSAGYSDDEAILASFGAVGCSQVIATLVSVVLVDYIGRQKLLVASSLGMI